MKTRKLVDMLDTSARKYPDQIFSTPGKAYSCINPYSYHIYKKVPEVYEALDGLFVDGMTMCWWVRLLWGKKIPRLSFDMAGMAVDLFARLNSPSCQEEVYFIGARQDEIESTMEQVQKSYPNLRINGFRNGYFKDNGERDMAIREIISKSPEYVIVGMGSPLQEKFVVDLREAGYKGIAFTCGGFLHQTSSRMNYYPDWVNRYNLRAFYRLTHEKGMFARLWKVLVSFPLRFTLDSMVRR